LTPVDRPGPGTGRGGGRWSSAVDCESVGSGSDFAGPPRGTWAAQVASSGPAGLPDVVALADSNQSSRDSQERRPCSTAELDDDVMATSTGDHAAR